jgi:transcriptional regulator with XRE-family HTH domain
MTNSTDIPRHTAKALRDEMENSPKTTRELAELLGVTYESARRRYQGITPLTLIELAVVARWLGVPRSNLFPDVAA